MFLCLYKPDLIFITETWLTTKILDSELVGNLPYNVYRSDRSMRRGGGVCVLVKAFISAQIVTGDNDLKADLLSAEILCADDLTQLRFILVYRPPNSSAADDKKLVDVLSDLAVMNHQTIILGDFNLHIDWINSVAFNSSSSLFLDFFTSADFVQNVNLPTHADKVLDILLTPSAYTLDVELLPPLASSDHAIVHFETPVSMSAPRIPFPNFFAADYLSLNDYFSGVDWFTLFNQYSSCSDIYRRFCKKVYEGLAKFVPFRFPRPFCSNLPPQLKALISQKQRLFEELNHPLHNPLYKKVCSDIDFHMKRYLRYRERHLVHSKSMKPFYLYLRHKMKGNGKLPGLTDQTGVTYIRDADKANALALHFASVFSSECSNNTPEIVGIGPIQQQCRAIFFHPSDIYKYLKSLKPSVSETYDGIPPIVYKECAATLCCPLAHIFNISMLLGEVPEVWKSAIVTAIPKSPGTNLLSNYRPISLLPTPVKIMEKIIRDKLLSWLKKFHLIPAQQHGFVGGASTSTNLIDSIFDWSLACNQGKSIDIIYVDLSKAFDKVCHSKLIAKLKYFGITGHIIDWMISYLNMRSMTVKVGHKYSAKFPCRSGVPQGGVLSPLLFLIYTIDLPNVIRTSSHVSVQMYADDIKIYGIYDDENYLEVRNALQTSLAKMSDWASKWDLRINHDKSLVMHIGKGNVAEYSMNGVALKICKSVRDLGIFVDYNLNFTEHIDHIVRKAYSALFRLFRIVHTSNPTILTRLYKSFVLPHLEYGSQIWSPSKKKIYSKARKGARDFYAYVMQKNVNRLSGE
ncbi:hypothetical protein RB195_024937 [Necator americanus]|uniref:Reverse transcriptase domain-containing protein n=2 Tax=Necator americanus TaxID=51031 RepID=A0ABR1ESD8_NECAM